MNRFIRYGLQGCASALLLAAFAAPASAQYVGGGFGTPGFRTPGVQFNFIQTRQYSVGSGLGPGLSFGYTLSGPIGYGIYNRNNNQQSSFLSTPSYSGYMTGGARPNDAAARDFARAQQMAASAARSSPVAARNAIYDQWAYEKLGVVGLPGIKPGEDAPAALLKALSGASEADIASGEALNHIVVGIVAAEKKGKADSAYLPPNLLAEVRFAGPPAADAINLMRQAGKLNFPAVFDSPALAEIRPVLERDFAAATAPVLIGKPADFAKVAKLEQDVAKARAILDPITKDLEFADATAARRFLNQLDSTVGVLKGAGTSGLIDPRWATEGTSIADLVKHLVKNKLLFAPVAKGEEEAYAALHRGLAAYLFVLNESQKPPKK